MFLISPSEPQIYPDRENGYKSGFLVLCSGNELFPFVKKKQSSSSNSYYQVVCLIIFNGFDVWSAKFWDLLGVLSQN